MANKYTFKDGLNKNGRFIMEADTYGHFVVCTIYTSYIDHFTPQHSFEQSAACLSVVFVTSSFYTVCNIVTRWVNF